MSKASIATPSRLSDDLERELLRRSANESESLSLVATFKAIGRGLGDAFAAFSSYMISLADVLNEARAKDPRSASNLW
ncbi:MAG: hypothetical protein WC284_13725 [Candidimonas sp.]|jgi:hypothetical protein